MRKKITASLLLFWGAHASAITINSSEYGGEWPFTVESGDLKCINGRAVVFAVNDNEYAVNGTAIALKFKRIDEIWRQDPESLLYAETVAKKENKSVGEIQTEMGILRVDMRPVLERGLSLCKSANH